MIDALRVAKTAHFYSLKRPLSNASVDELFRRVRAGHPSASQNVFFHRRSQAGESFWSAISFFYDRTPSFLSQDADFRERICGFILVVEHRDHVQFSDQSLKCPLGSQHAISAKSHRRKSTSL
ncbi:hypothetical protein [Bradyrhizobium sp. CCBAU 53380]|uniref:hypothetical protein n=1 Tax=Bradyrhizobium sp. CCBAU 53380 TaxID=1325117 RepID=UPI0023039547|nr:hypothetical protein [Bradyrhizobium sp. CCBAU 53380]